MSDQGTDPTTNAAAGVNPKRKRGPGAGRPRKSAALHILEGTRSRARSRGRNKPVAVDPALVTPPKGFPRLGRVLWLLNAARLARCGRLKVQHLSAWDAMCRRYAAYRRAETALERIATTSENYAAIASVAARAWSQYSSMSARFGLDLLSDAIVGARDGSSIDGETPAAELPASSKDEDPAERWEREFGRSG